MDTPERTHADQIRFERGLMKATGMTRTQLRKELKKFDAAQRVAGRERPPVIPVEPPVVQVRETKLAPVVEKLETGKPMPPVPINGEGDTTVVANSGASGASVLKTGTNVTARKIIGGTDIAVVENTDDITINYDGTPYGTATTVVALRSNGTTIDCREFSILAVDNGAFVP